MLAGGGKAGFQTRRVQLALCKGNANERNVSLLTNCRVQLALCKVTIIPRNIQLFLAFVFTNNQQFTDNSFALIFILMFFISLMIINALSNSNYTANSCECSKPSSSFLFVMYHRNSSVSIESSNEFLKVVFLIKAMSFATKPSFILTIPLRSIMIMFESNSLW